MRPRSRPFYPSQTETGSTYVVDSRSGKVISSVFCSFDQVERWQIAKQRAESMNDAAEAVFYARRVRIIAAALAALALVAALFAAGVLHI